MKQAIHEFITLLRKPGIRVSLSEALDSLEGLKHIEVTDKMSFRTLLECTLIKKRDDLPEFSRLFHLYFEKHRFSHEGGPSREILDRALEIMEGEGAAFPEFFKNFLRQGIEGVVPYLFGREGPQGGDASPYSIMAAYSSMKMGERMERERWGDRLGDLMRLLGKDGVDEAELEEFRAALEERMEHLKSLVQDLIESEKKNWKSWKAKNRGDALMEKGFRSLGPGDVEEIKNAVHELVKRIRDELALRERRRRIGKIDIKRTLRRSQQYGGIPVELFWKKRKRSRGSIVALCDVSNSVRNATRFMLTLLYSLQDQFSRVRSFVFVNELGEVTRFFENHEISDAIGMALTEAHISYDSYTDYGNVLLQFYENYIDIINSRTTVIIIGDGRNNYSHTREWVLEKMKSRARRIIWLNPEQRMSWGFGDSAVLIYQKYCTEVRECWKVSQLLKIVDDLIL